MICAVFVSGNWRIKEKFPVLKNHRGKEFFPKIHLCQLADRIYGNKTFTQHIFQPRILLFNDLKAKWFCLHTVNNQYSLLEYVLGTQFCSEILFAYQLTLFCSKISTKLADPISDMLTRIRNSQAVGKETVNIPFSAFKFELAALLLKNGYIAQADAVGSGIGKKIVLALKYLNNKPAIRNIRRISKSGQRIYVGYDKIRPILNGYGMSVISTPRGLMTNKDALKNKIGGEIICEVW